MSPAWIPVISGLLLAVAAATTVRQIVGGDWLMVISHAGVLLAALALMYAVHSALTRWLPAGRLMKVIRGAWTVFFVSSLLMYYLIFFVCILAFSEIPTRRLIAGYFVQSPALIAALPFSAHYLIIGLGLILAFILLSATGALSCLNRVEKTLAFSLPSHLLTIFIFVLSLFLSGLAVRPAPAYANLLADAREPLTRALQDRPLMEESFAWANSYENLAVDASVALRYSAIRPAQRNVIVIYVDALRADEAQSYGASRKNMPYVTSLVESGVLRQVPWSMAACPSTVCGLAALLQSRVAHRQHPQHFSLPLALGRHGYRVAYVLSSDHQSYFDLKAFYGGKSIDFYRDGRDVDPRRSTDDFMVVDGIKELGPATRKPTFLMLGLLSPHAIAHRHKQFERYQPSRVSPLSSREKQIEAVRNHYHNGLLQADAVLREIWLLLTELGYLEDAIVVITGDHGESLGERSIFGHGRSLFNTELRTPLWVFDSRSPEPLPEFVRQIDIAPIIMSRIDAPIPSTWMGVADGSVEWSDHVFPANPNEAAVIRIEREGIWKYMVSGDGREHFFGLHNDPSELRDLSSVTPSPVLEPFRARARQLVSEMRESRGRVR